MNAFSPEALRRGWCPSALKPMETGDGWLVRLHPPGAVLTPAQLIRIAQLARQHGNGLVEISARANLQLRGVSLATHPDLVATLLAERLVEEHDGEGPQRLTLTAPLPGLSSHRPHPEEPRSGVSKDAPVRADASFETKPAASPQDEGSRGKALIDAGHLAETIEAQARAIPGLPAKTLVIVDDGGPFSLDGFACDLRVVAVAQGMVAIGLAGGRWLGPVDIAGAPNHVTDILSRFATHRRDDRETIRRLRDLPPALRDEMVANSGLPLTDAPTPRPAPCCAGRFITSGRQALLVGLPFGRSDAETLEQLGKAAQRAGVRAIRLSPWRGLAFSGLEPGDVAPLLRVASELGIIVDPDDPRLSIQACAGKACQRAESDAIGDAATLAEAAAPLLDAGASIHVSGCVKSCAHPGASDLTLVGRDGGYDVIVAGTTRDAPIATLDLPAILARLRPGQDLFTRVSARGTAGPGN